MNNSEIIRRALEKLSNERAIETSDKYVGGSADIEPYIIDFDNVKKGKGKCKKCKSDGEMMGKKMAEMVIKESKMSGSGFWDSFSDTISKVGKVASKVAPVLHALPTPITQQLGLTADALATTGAVTDAIKGKGKGKRKRKISDKMKKRNLLIKKLMKEEGMKLGEASKYIKDNGLL